MSPSLDGGRYPVKRTQGDRVEVVADVVCDGPEVVRAVLRHRPPEAPDPVELPMSRDEYPDRFRGAFVAEPLGVHAFTVEAWIDRFSSWRQELDRKLDAGQESLAVELSEAAVLLAGIATSAHDAGDRRLIDGAVALLVGEEEPEQLAAALDPALASAVARWAPRDNAAVFGWWLEVDVDRERARIGAWYELFPRSWGGFRGVEATLPELAELGFDVVYLPPVHPIGRTNRKGRNNALSAADSDPGSPWAIGGREGGHDALHPELGTLADFERLVGRATELGLEIAIDFAVQCSADHPWLAEHPEWFKRRPDGTIKYAENPPKRYEDIVALDLESPDWRGLWDALLEVVLLWVDRGVRIFRVDNPHTKPFAFWEWLIRRVRDPHPDVVFLSEAFTRPVPMQTLAKLGFSQSYTYFTWRITRADLADYVRELAGPQREYFRPNFFANTPDILHEYLQLGGQPAFEARLVLAATLSPSYGIYSGFERCENVPLREGSEEYRDSEKYEFKERRLEGPLLPLIGRVNAIRRENPALGRIDNVSFVETGNDSLIAYVKQDGANRLVVVVNLDAHAPQEGYALLPPGIGLPDAFTAHDLLTGSRYAWQGRNYARLEPGIAQAHIMRVEP